MKFHLELDMEEALDVIFALGYAERAFERDLKRITTDTDTSGKFIRGCRARMERFRDLEQKYSGVISRPPAKEGE